MSSQQVVPCTEFEVGKKVYVLYNARAKGKKRTTLHRGSVVSVSATFVAVRFDAPSLGQREQQVTPKSCYSIPSAAAAAPVVAGKSSRNNNAAAHKWSPAKDDVVLVRDDADDCCYSVARVAESTSSNSSGNSGGGGGGANAMVSVVWLDVARASPQRVKLDDVVPVAPAVWHHFYKVGPMAATAVDVLGLASRKRTRDDAAPDDKDADDLHDDNNDDELDLLPDADLPAAAAAAASAAAGSEGGAAARVRAWSPVDADDEAEAERIRRAEEAYKKMIAVRTTAEAKLLQTARERRFVRLRRSTRYVESNETARWLPPAPGAPTVAQLDATWRAARVAQLPAASSAATAREWLGGELLVPVDIDVTIEQQRLQDTVTLPLWDRTLAPLDIAQSICADYCLPAPFEKAIAAQLQQTLAAIETQLEAQFAELRAASAAESAPARAAVSPHVDDFEVLDRVNERGEIQAEFLTTLRNLHTIDERTRREVADEFRIDVSASAATPHAAADRLSHELAALAADGSPPPHEDLRVIEINFVFGTRQFTDRFEWDIACVGNSPELFAASVGADIGLPRAYVAQLAAQLRRAIAAAHALPATAANTRTTSALFGVPVPTPSVAAPRGIARVDDVDMRRRVVRVADPVHLQPWTPYFGPPRLYDSLLKEDDAGAGAGGPRLRRRAK